MRKSGAAKIVGVRDATCRLVNTNWPTISYVLWPTLAVGSVERTRTKTFDFGVFWPLSYGKRQSALKAVNSGIVSPTQFGRFLPLLLLVVLAEIGRCLCFA